MVYFEKYTRQVFINTFVTIALIISPHTITGLSAFTALDIIIFTSITN